MSDEKKDNETGNVFDRIFRENAQDLFIPFVEMELGLKIKSFKALQEKITKTLEREVDFLCKITTESNKEQLLHIEFQTEKDNEMLYRMQEYHALINRKYKLPIYHIVIYLGTNKSKMISQLEPDSVFTGFKLICVNEIDANRLLTTQVPEIILMALLGRYEKNKIEELLQSILNKLKQLSVPNKIPGRYINQLIMLSRLRNLEEQTSKILNNMPITYDINNDALYLQGIEKGIEEGIEKGATNKEIQAIVGLHKEGVDTKIIAKALNIPIDRVRQVIEEWTSKK